MATYEVHWSKAYYANGVMEIVADSPEAAEAEMDRVIGDQEGNMQYHPEDNLIEVLEINNE